MAGGVVSKNLYDLLGNDQDGDEQPRAPVVPIEKPAQRSGKRNGVDEKIVKDTPQPSRGGGGRGGRGGRRGDFSGNEGAYQDRDAGRSANRGRSTDEGTQRSFRNSERTGGERRDRRGGGVIEGRGHIRARGGRTGEKMDRHSQTGQTDSEKQIEKGWGDGTAVGELQDEKAGEQIAWNEGETEPAGVNWNDDPMNADNATADNAAAFTGDNETNAAPAAEPEPEDKSQSYADYLEEQKKKREQLGSTLKARQANEGASKKQPEGKAIERSNSEDYFVGGAGKKQRERGGPKDKNALVLDYDIQPRERDAAPRGGRGGRGGRGRGEGGFRGGEGRGRGGRGRGGDFRGDSFRGDSSRGGRGGGGRGGASPNVTDESAFPSLGGK